MPLCNAMQQILLKDNWWIKDTEAPAIPKLAIGSVQCF